MATAKFQYKCRQCGTVYSDSATSLEQARNLLVGVVFDSEINMPLIGIPPTLLEIHACSSASSMKGLGVADLIGIIEDN